MTKTLSNSMLILGQQAKLASHKLAHVSTAQKNAALEKIANQIEKETSEILAANAADHAEARASGLSDAMLDRLLLNDKRMQTIVADLRSVMSLPDPVGEHFDEQIMTNGLKMHKQRVPMGVLGVIYESRPNVTVDVAGLALKSGNCVIMRGGKETLRSNIAFIGAIQRGLQGSGIPAEAIQLVADTNRGLVLELLQMDQYVDMIIPRGGAGLHDFCHQNSRIPVITGGIGICHLFVDESADLDKSIEVIRNAKIQRPSVCNALDTVLVHVNVAKTLLPRLVKRLSADGVTFRAEDAAFALLKSEENVKPASEEDFDTEWLSLVLGLKVVNDMDEAIEHIARHSTAHSDGILTNSQVNAERFLEMVDSAAVYVNASTRFTDGSQMGLGAEIAISTQRMHARGPMGLRELTTFKWVVQGDYHVRS
ncbi:MAG: glutamate-5-semialdehyde dehydrogenase [Chloroflexi bacterium HGW-Chloroflexi-5]|jgi:glutamate-5-semialdehyde dehydrogenase|nr:MAG: glutamate-5-semialdehyde dehydrogenase [Chloroflexi bacterium HGW-Chloroflexi-5]